jgi:hypothetical protein
MKHVSNCVFHLRFLFLSTQCYSAERMNKEASSVANMHVFPSTVFSTYADISSDKLVTFFIYVHLCQQPCVRNHRLGVLFPKSDYSLSTIPEHFRYYLHFLWLIIFFITGPFP